MVVLGGGAVSYEHGTPVLKRHKGAARTRPESPPSQAPPRMVLCQVTSIRAVEDAQGYLAHKKQPLTRTLQ